METENQQGYVDWVERVSKALAAQTFPFDLHIKGDEVGHVQMEFQAPMPYNSTWDSREDKKEMVDIKEAAKLLCHSVWWLRRKENREKKGIYARRMGGKWLFNKKELLAAIENGRERKVGRPRRRLVLKTSDGKLYDI